MDLGIILWTPDADGAADGAADGGVDGAALLAMAGARQAASPTAQAQARLPVARRQTGAAFAGQVANAIARWDG